MPGTLVCSRSATLKSKLVSSLLYFSINVTHLPPAERISPAALVNIRSESRTDTSTMANADNVRRRLNNHVLVFARAASHAAEAKVVLPWRR